MSRNDRLRTIDERCNAQFDAFTKIVAEDDSKESMQAALLVLFRKNMDCERVIGSLVIELEEARRDMNNITQSLNKTNEVVHSLISVNPKTPVH